MVFSVSNQSVTRCHGNILAVMEERGLLRLVEMARGYFFWGVVLTKEPRLLEEGGNWAENVREGRYHIFWGVGYKENEVSWGTRDLGRERKRERERERVALFRKKPREEEEGWLAEFLPTLLERIFFRYVYCGFPIHFNWYAFLLFFGWFLDDVWWLGVSKFIYLFLMIFVEDQFGPVSVSHKISTTMFWFSFCTHLISPTSPKPVDYNMKHDLYRFIFCFYHLCSIFVAFLCSWCLSMVRISFLISARSSKEL